MKSEVKGKIYEIRGKLKETEGKINGNNRSTADFVNYVINKQKEFRKHYSMTQKPLTDIIETSDALIIKMDLPGLNKEDLEVDIGGNRVYIKAKFEEEHAVEDINFIQKDRNYGIIMKSITLPTNIEFEETTANFTNSILTITIPKKHKESYSLDIDSV
jgi:HSP20 family protein